MNHIIHILLLQLDPKEKVKFSNTLIFLDLVPLQSKFFPAKFFFCIWKMEIWREKIYFAKKVFLFFVFFDLKKKKKNLVQTFSSFLLNFPYISHYH
jgi:hypothetical protein